MRPLAFINAIVFGSATATAFGLTGVLVIFLILRGSYPQFATELVPLLRSSGIFVALAGVSGLSFYALQKDKRWRWQVQALMWGCVVLTAWFYMPRAG
jgi:hypothetical protein